MSDFVFGPAPVRAIPVQGIEALYPVHRIFCVGRNYAEHAREMGGEVDRSAPFYFTKSALALTATGATVPYPPGTADYHHEMELVVALGAALFRATPDQVRAAIFGYAAGLDMTRRDLQAAAKDKRRPWDTGKDFEHSAIVAPITPAADVGSVGPQRICLWVNGAVRQEAHLGDMVWSVEELICHLSTLYHLGPGDLIFTGTPAGVGPVCPGDVIEGKIDGLDPVRLAIAAPE
ncbi:fumarylacetoacetase [Rhodobacter veldkampii DSM 11550]|uniref:Fumarylacetoacetase n=1 Tax=Phaeovulum veldkampii DSM 11550 TaxID=1185920 RepID=A0A2T4JJ65_9RHOB|nr:fumarylacetoacetate hydrolase family protein [Phaeovulum veldkampii]MBK5947261.1 fumarylacetoacetase [Phaeovulum veldkampii DSM 11550]PTE17918.1 fumarylacetoacetase [Phaeovulum veldkampii DSM 11550]TDQ56733.1 fumarylpyruvate hydrolase [Phaeovulum veldkampii DSM 11550]